MSARVYISGPITGIEQLNRPAFEQAAIKLQAAGLTAVNPHDNGQPEWAPWQTHMRADLKILVDCDALVLLQGWEKSKGAKLERLVAVGLGLRVYQTVEGAIAGEARAA